MSRDPVQRKIRKLIAEGKSEEQATAIALNMMRDGRLGPRGGYRRKPRRNGAMPRVPDAIYKDYVRKHWGEKPDFVYEVDDDRLPPMLVEMGKLQEIDVDVMDEAGKETGETLHVDFPDDDRCILGYDPDTHRLYTAYPVDVRRDLVRRLWHRDAPDYPLATVARLCGNGRHSKPGGPRYPVVRVQVLGPVISVIYFTNKRGDGPSRYRHELGEDTHIRPELCVSRDGCLWFAGGNYVVRKHGIID